MKQVDVCLFCGTPELWWDDEEFKYKCRYCDYACTQDFDKQVDDDDLEYWAFFQENLDY